MRGDERGLFWEDPIRAGRGDTYRPMPSIPDTGWKMPEFLPDLSKAKMISIDTETFDPDLLTHGPGWGRHVGHIVGISVGVETGERWYFPMRHTVGENMDPDRVLLWASREFRRENQPKVFANAIYDLGWLAEEGVFVKGEIIDVQIAEPLLDENARSYALEALAQKWLGEHKKDELLYSWCSRAYGGKPERKQAGNIYRAPAKLVGPYAETDADLPLRIWQLQKEQLEKEGLMDLFRLEMRLTPMLIAMRMRGVPVDVDRAEKLYEEFNARENALNKAGLAGVNVNVNDDLEAIAKKRGLEVPKLETGNSSFAGLWLQQNMPDVAEMRKIQKARDTFISSYILEKHVNGRLHCQFNQLRSDDSGTVSGRFSSSNPNLQNIPNRDPEIGPLVRGLYLPEQGERWVRFDWSQIEFRLVAHYGIGDSAEATRVLYREDPTTDFHALVAEMVWPGQPEMRKPAKNINFGLVYGMADRTMAANLGRTLEEVKPTFEMYHERLPFVRMTAQKISDVASRRGYVKTLLGRRRRFDLWEPATYGKQGKALPLEQAVSEYGRIRRAFTHKATNAVMQGSAADLMKLAMVQMWESGVCDVLGAPLVTVHDELGWSSPHDAQALEALVEVKRIMEQCIALKVPIIAEREEGDSWGSVK